MTLDARPLRPESGFTLIELLVVILIIGILAAIALPAFLGQRSKGQDSSAKSDARNLVTQIEACFVEAQNYSSCDDSSELKNTSLPLDSVFPPATPGDLSAGGGFHDFTVVALSKSGNTFSLVHDDTNLVTRTCSSPSGNGSCNSGNW